jgi:hypothetical protein
MGWLSEVPDVFSPVPWTERDEREARIALRVVALASPFIVMWLLASPLVYVFLTKSANAKLRTFDFVAIIHSQIVPCHGWFDGGFNISYQPTPRAKVLDGKLCRAIGDDDWTWYPQ